MPDTWPKPPTRTPIQWRERKRIAYLAIALTVAFVLLFAGAALLEIFWLGTQDLRLLILENFLVVVGLPLAALFAFIIVILFVVDVQGAVSFKMFGLEFSGPGGPILLWAIAFLSIVGAFKILSI